MYFRKPIYGEISTNIQLDLLRTVLSEVDKDIVKQKFHHQDSGTNY